MEQGALYWYYPKEISKDICQKIIDLGKDKWETAGIVKGKIKDRKSEVYWVSEQWLYDLIWPYMLNANEQTTIFYMEMQENFQ